MKELFSYIPAGSLVILQDEERPPYIQDLLALPNRIRSLATSAKTGAYIKGLAKTFSLSVTQGEQIAFAVFEVITGRQSLASLPALLSTKLKIANDKAQKLAQEIERDLFAPVSLELNNYLAQKKQKTGSMADKLGSPPTNRPNRTSTSAKPPATSPNNSKFPRRPAAPPNILNLKGKKNPPAPPPIPR